MEKDTIRHIINYLRQATITWPGRTACINRHSKKFNVGKYKNGKIKFKKKIQCQSCKEWFDQKNIEVDHIEEVGSFRGDWNEYITRLFCGQENLQPLCIKCHSKKTSKYNSTLTFKRKNFKDL